MHELIGGPTFAEVLNQARRAASTSAAVLVTGETGVGKELIASYIHTCSPRANRPFVAVNCAGFAAGSAMGTVSAVRCGTARW
jgi:transcriptional regulator with PAS, ATPase and Fis domain